MREGSLSLGPHSLFQVAKGMTTIEFLTRRRQEWDGPLNGRKKAALGIYIYIYVYICVYIYINMCVCICIYIYIFGRVAMLS